MAIFRHMLGYNDNYTRTVGLIRGFGQLHSCWGAPLLSLEPCSELTISSYSGAFVELLHLHINVFLSHVTVSRRVPGM